MSHSFVSVVLLAAVASGPVGVGDFAVPEDFFMGMPQPDDTVQFVYTCPSSLDAQTIERESGWWNACAKLSVLMRQDLDFRAAYVAASKDPALSATGITFKEWSRSSQARKEELRLQLVVVAKGIAERNGLPKRLATTAVDETLVAEQRTRNEKNLADRLGVTGDKPARLVEFCPGAADNVSVNAQHPAFDRFKQLMKQQAAAEQYKFALRAFSAYLDAHPASSIDERNAELARLLDPILKDVH